MSYPMVFINFCFFKNLSGPEWEAESLLKDKESAPPDVLGWEFRL